MRHTSLKWLNGISSALTRITSSRARSLAAVLAMLIGAVALAVVVRAYNHEPKSVQPVKSPTASPPASQATSPGNQRRLLSRLSFQPEADRFRRRLGRRFTDPGRERATSEGTLNVGAQQFQVRIVRTQEDDGEQVEIALSGGGGSLTWNGKDGAKSAGRSATGLDRTLIERITLDSPDQFILAQLRGASYYTIARMVAPKDADENYSGPVWDLVRIVEPQHGSWNKPQNEWRIYYINNATGLIDRIIYQDQAQNITVDFSGWASRGGELDPSLIRWSRDGKAEMELSLNNAGHGSK